MGYWDLVEPVWYEISVREGPDKFLQTFSAAPIASALLFAAHSSQSEICNGGFWQFFFNAAGVLAPEAIEAFQAIKMPLTADTISKAVALVGDPYPRERQERMDRLKEVSEDALSGLDREFLRQIKQENGGFEKCADEFAASPQD